MSRRRFDESFTLDALIIGRSAARRSSSARPATARRSAGTARDQKPRIQRPRRRRFSSRNSSSVSTPESRSSASSRSSAAIPFTTPPLSSDSVSPLVCLGTLPASRAKGAAEGSAGRCPHGHVASGLPVPTVNAASAAAPTLAVGNPSAAGRIAGACAVQPAGTIVRRLCSPRPDRRKPSFLRRGW